MTFNTEAEMPPKEGDRRVIDGIEHVYEKLPWTLRQYFSHDGPGWDFKERLTDSEWAMKKFGRTFTEKEAFNPAVLPELPMYGWKPVRDK